MRDPRYLNFSTCCNLESLSLILHFGVSRFLEVTMVTVFLAFSPRPTAWLFSFMMLRCCRSFSDVAITAMSSAYRRLLMVRPLIVMPEDHQSPAWCICCRVRTSPVKARSLASLLFWSWQISKFIVISYGCCLVPVQGLDNSEVSSIYIECFQYKDKIFMLDGVKSFRVVNKTQVQIFLYFCGSLCKCSESVYGIGCALSFHKTTLLLTYFWLDLTSYFQHDDSDQ